MCGVFVVKPASFWPRSSLPTKSFVLFEAIINLSYIIWGNINKRSSWCVTNISFRHCLQVRSTFTIFRFPGTFSEDPKAVVTCKHSFLLHQSTKIHVCFYWNAAMTASSPGWRDCFNVSQKFHSFEKWQGCLSLILIKADELTEGFRFRKVPN